MYKIAVCDDDKNIANYIERLTLEEAVKHSIELETDVFWCGKSLAEYIEAGNRLDIIYIDIEMPDENGLETARRIRKIDPLVLIIYVSSHDEFMQETFEVRPFRFLKKPVDTKRFKVYFEAAIREMTNSDNYYHYKFRRILKRVCLREVLYFESEKRRIKIVKMCNDGHEIKDDVKLGQNDEYMYCKMNTLDVDLKRSKVPFLRIHQSYLVNYLYMAEIACDHVVMVNGESIPISEERRKHISKIVCSMGDGISDIW